MEHYIPNQISELLIMWKYSTTRVKLDNVYPGNVVNFDI